MTVVKVVELLAQSPDGWEAATQEALRVASKTIRGIQSLYVENMQALVENNQITMYRVNVKVSFKIEDQS